jgi:peptidoglycan hydrolase-like protein with peptidoglycan-binding domain
VIVAGAALAGVVVAATALMTTRSGGTSSAGTTTVSTATAAVTRTNLSSTERVSGQLEFEPTRPFVNQRQGTLTELPSEGDTIEAGGVAYRVDNEPTVLLYGEVPAYRTLDSSASDGDDIAQLQQNLIALGFGDGVTVDGAYDSATESAVAAFQESVGLDDDGVLDLGEVVFMPSAVRVANVSSQIGATVQTGAEVIETTTTQRVVTADVTASQASLVELGDPVTITLPNRSDTGGTVRSITTSSAASTSQGAAGATAGGGATAAGGTAATGTDESTTTLLIDLDDSASASAWDSASVNVEIVRQKKEDVLAVPVTALLALAEGGYAVEVADPATGATRLVRVRPGLQAGDQVEVTGELSVGDEVVVPE